MNEEAFSEHKDTGKVLGCSVKAKFSMNNCGMNCPVMIHLEVFGRDNSMDSITRWSTTIEIYLPL